MRSIFALIALASAQLIAVASAQNMLQLLTSTVPAGKPYNLTTLQSLLTPQILGNDTFNAYVAALSGGANLTVFAPTDAAFAKTIAALGGLDAVLPLVPQILSYHISTTVVTPAYLGATPVSFIPTLLGNSSLSLIKPQVLEVNFNGSAVKVYSANAGFANVIDSAVATNGIVHVVDSVLIPPATATETLKTINDAKIPGVAFTQLAGALTALNLTSAVDTVTPITIFAPIDIGFEKVTKALNKEQLDAYLKTVVTYHVIAGAAAYFPPSGTYTTLQGEDVTVVSNSSTQAVTINGNPVLDTVLISNGVVHALGEVLIPPTIAKALTASPDYKCGSGIGTCAGTCCSLYGWCCVSEAHCLLTNGCQTLYGYGCH